MAKRIRNVSKRMQAAGVMGCFLFAATGYSQVSSRPTPPSQPAGISYAGGQLRIDVVNATLAEVLSKVAAVTGVKIDLPEPADPEKMSSLKLGPGSPREILASLLRDSHLNYLIQSSDSEPGKLLSVLILPEDKKSSSGEPPAVSGPFRARYPRTSQPAVKPEEDAPPASVTVAQSDPPSAGSDTPQAPVEPDQSAPARTSAAAAVDPSEAHPGAMNPPPVLTKDTISQQLQQMYQQRSEITQQEHQTGQLVTASENH